MGKRSRVIQIALMDFSEEFKGIDLHIFLEGYLLYYQDANVHFAIDRNRNIDFYSNQYAAVIVVNPGKSWSYHDAPYTYAERLSKEYEGPIFGLYNRSCDKRDFLYEIDYDKLEHEIIQCNNGADKSAEVFSVVTGLRVASTCPLHHEVDAAFTKKETEKAHNQRTNSVVVSQSTDIADPNEDWWY